MSSRALLTALVAGAVVASCGTKSPCSEGSRLCEGCCDALGVCLSGTATAACGKSAAVCIKCAPGDVCSAGACAATTSCTTTSQCPVLDCRCGDGATATARDCAGFRCRSASELCDDACTASGHPKPAGVGTGTTYSFCVDGTMAACQGADLKWSGGRCCVVTGYGQCSEGTAAACSGPDLRWTGSTCCSKAQYGQCLDGTLDACTGDSLEWTGLKCCVKDAYALCVDGTASACGGAGLIWTGAQCCALAEYIHCVAGKQDACASPDMRWTGAKCCVRNRLNCADGDPATCTGEWTGAKCCT